MEKRVDVLGPDADGLVTLRLVSAGADQLLTFPADSIEAAALLHWRDGGAPPETRLGIAPIVRMWNRRPPPGGRDR